LVIAVLAIAASPAAAMTEPACYDVKIRARPVDQVPSEIRECGSDCIITSWPWFVDLQVERVIDGTLSEKVVRILTIQHTYFLPRSGTWALRRNAAGGSTSRWPTIG
jgi:hypothetical protein